MVLTGLGIAIGVYIEKSWNQPQKRMVLLEDEDEEMERENSVERSQYEWLLTRDPRTGRIPDNIRVKELDWAETLPQTQNNMMTPLVSNAYSVAGPTQNGGRTRTVVFDRRYNGTSNKVILAGGVTGGIFRSTDGGETWRFVHPPTEIRSVSTIAQDPSRPDTWYAGTGEPIGASAGYPNAFVFGNGMFKSTDNGVTWTKLASTNVSDPNSLSSQWSFVHKVVVHPTNGHVYAAVHRRIVRSTDGGNTWTEVFGSNIASNSFGGIGDIVINNAGTRIYVAMSGRSSDRDLAGVFSSGTGNTGSFVRFAGGVKDAADSVAGWRAYSTSASAGWGKIVLSLAPSNQNLLYVLVQNFDDADKSQPEADLFRCNLSNMSWTKHTDNLVAKRTPASGTATDKYIELQNGYNMVIAVHPTRPETVLVGGVNLFRSTDGFSTKDNVTFIGGLSSTSYTESDPRNPVSHVDFHALTFDPSDVNKLIIGSDGGLQYIRDVTATSPVWSGANGQYQTLQYYHVGIDPTPGSRVFYGGAQDNSTTIRDRAGLLGTPLSDSNDHYIVLGGDGCQVGMTKKNNEGKQFLFCAAQNGQVYRMNLFPPFDASTLYTKIKPNATGDGIFVTYFHLDPDNTDFLYYVSKDSIFRTKNAATVTSSTWTLMDGVAPRVNGDIYSMETTRGNYSANSHLFIGTSAGKVYRLKDPQNAATSTAPDDITPPNMQSGSVVKDISINPRNQDTLMVVVSNYNVNSIFWTGNATAASPTWQVVDGNIDLPSIRSCEIVAKTNGVEYYAGTTVGLYSTTQMNGVGTVWARETGIAGSPSEMINTAIINALAHRWQDNTLVVGTHGNGMFVANVGNAINLITSITNPIRNNTDFIRNLYPTITRDVVNYQVGNLYGVRRLSVQVTSLSGAIVQRNETGYTNGQINLGNLPAGMYIVSITSADRKYQFTKKIIKN